MAVITGTLEKTPIAVKTYWFVITNCSLITSIVSFSKITNNSNMVFNSAVVNATDITDCDGNTYAAGKVIVIQLSAGADETNESCKVVYTTNSGETDSFVFDVSIKELHK